MMAVADDEGDGEGENVGGDGGWRGRGQGRWSWTGRARMTGRVRTTGMMGRARTLEALEDKGDGGDVEGRQVDDGDGGDEREGERNFVWIRCEWLRV